MPAGVPEILIVNKLPVVPTVVKESLMYKTRVALRGL
jgi:hypothetical protein